MRILLDARAIEAPLHGIARYGWNLIRAYAAMDLPHAFHVILGPGGWPEPWDPPPNFRVERIPVRPYGIAEQIRMPRALARVACDLDHTLTYTAPLLSRHPLVLSIFDLIHLRYPEEYSPLHPMYYRLVVRRLVARARAVITLSEASKRDIVERLRADPKKVRVTYLAADPRFGEVSSAEIDRVLSAYHLAPGYFFHLSNYRRHKNAEGVVRAYARLARERGFRVGLVLAGGAPPTFRAWLSAEGMEREARVLGPVPDADLPALYAAAGAFVFPSRCEGFGLPVLEAMACGTPVVTSRASSLPEVVGDAALLVDPDDEKALVDAMDRALATDMRAELSALGRERAALFSWARVARETLAVYEAVVDGG